MRIKVKLEGMDRKSAEFSAARRDIRDRVKEGVKRAGEIVVLPEAKRLAPVKTGRLKASLIAQGKGSGTGIITTALRGKQARYVGLQEFGGTVKTPIRPKRRGKGNHALRINGSFVAQVRTPRRYRGKLFMSRAVEHSADKIGEVIKDEIMKALEPLNG